MTSILVLTRITALGLGAAAAGVGCYASYEAAAKADGGYLMVAAPVVALAAALIPAYFETAFRVRQWLRGLVLFLVWLPCAATVFYTAVERNHMAKAGGEAQRAALHTAVERAKAELVDANRAKATATTAADKVRGLEGKACNSRCMSIKATEAAAIKRAADAEKALATAEAQAVTESSLKQQDWLLPLALDVVGMILVGTAFGLGQRPKVETIETLTPRQIAARRGVKTRKQNKQLRNKARKIGPRLAVSK